MLKSVNHRLNFAWALLAGLLIAATAAGCGPEGLASVSAPVSTPPPDTAVSNIAHPRFYYSSYYDYYPNNAQIIVSSISGASYYVATIVPPATTFTPLPTVTAKTPSTPAPPVNLERLAQLLLGQPRVPIAVSMPDPDTAPLMPPGMEHFQILFGYNARVAMSPTDISCLLSISISVKNMLYRTMLTSITYYYAVRDENGNILRDGTVTTSLGVRYNRSSSLAGPSWFPPSGVDVSATTVELRVIDISYEESY